MAIVGQARTYHKQFRFQVQIDGLDYAGFQSCSELSSEFAETAHYEGGTIIPDKSPGRMTFDDVTLQRGVTGDNQLYEWHLQVGSAADDAVANLPDAYKRQVDICQYDLQGQRVIRRWRLTNAWPKRYVAGSWDNDSDENVVEQLVLAYDYFFKVEG
jgi:phage tail-like protein